MEGELKMPTLQILRNGQIALPAEFRRDLGLKKGDIMNAEIQAGRIILTPVALIEKTEAEKRAEAKEKFFETVDKLRERTEYVPLEEIQSTIGEAIAAARQAELSTKGQF